MDSRTASQHPDIDACGLNGSIDQGRPCFMDLEVNHKGHRRLYPIYPSSRLIHPTGKFNVTSDPYRPILTTSMPLLSLWEEILPSVLKRLNDNERSALSLVMELGG